jgi:hypothetical protein
MRERFILVHPYYRSIGSTLPSELYPNARHLDEVSLTITAIVYAGVSPVQALTRTFRPCVYFGQLQPTGGFFPGSANLGGALVARAPRRLAKNKELVEATSRTLDVSSGRMCVISLTGTTTRGSCRNTGLAIHRVWMTGAKARREVAPQSRLTYECSRPSMV